MLTLNEMREAIAEAIGTMNHAVLDNDDSFVIVTLVNWSIGDSTFFSDDVRSLTIPKNMGRVAAGNRIEEFACDVLNPYT
jgi:hypothetical protein